MTTLLENYADFVAIGTIGDIVSLTGENRALVQAGLPLLSHSDRPGICALLEQASMSGKELSSTNVAVSYTHLIAFLPPNPIRNIMDLE